MKFDRDIYFGLLCGGKVRRAVAYLRQFPEKASLAQRLERRMTQPPRLRTGSPWLNRVLSCFARYYQRLFWQGTTRQEGVRVLLEELCQLLEENGLAQPAEAADWKARTEQGMEAAEERVAARTEQEGYHYLGGETQGYFGPYVWKETKAERYQVELPAGMQDFTVQMMDGFVSRSWLDFISLGRIGAGGWASGGQLFCVRKCYVKKLDKPAFQVFFLKHEAQHVYDMERYEGLTAVQLEYRAKLVELIYAPNISRFRMFLNEADRSDPENSHAYASYLLVRNLSRLVFGEDYVPGYPRWKGKLAQIRRYSRVCYDAFPEMELLLGENEKKRGNGHAV